MKKSIAFFIFFIMITIVYAKNESKILQNFDKYEKILLELGAFPYMIEKGKPFYINAKGFLFRRDINGWVSPYQKDNIKLSVDEKVKYNYPPTNETILKWYNKYKWMISSEKYLKTKNINYKTILYFLLEINIMEELPVENCEELIKLIKLKTGYEWMIARLLEGKLSVSQAFDIFISINKIIEKDVFILDMLFPLIKGDTSDVAILQKYIDDKNNPIYFRWYFLYELYQMDQEIYRKQFIDSSINDIWNEKDDFKRSIMYDNMLKTDEDRIKKCSYKFIERELDTKCRIKILFILTSLQYIDNNILKIIKEISLGKGKYWHYYDFDMMKLEPTRWQDSLKCYINTMMENVKSKKVLKKLRKILNKLEKVRIRKMEDLDWYFNYFKIKEKEED